MITKEYRVQTKDLDQPEYTVTDRELKRREKESRKKARKEENRRERRDGSRGEPGGERAELGEDISEKSWQSATSDDASVFYPVRNFERFSHKSITYVQDSDDDRKAIKTQSTSSKTGRIINGPSNRDEADPSPFDHLASSKTQHTTTKIQPAQPSIGRVGPRRRARGSREEKRKQPLSSECTLSLLFVTFSRSSHSATLFESKITSTRASGQRMSWYVHQVEKC